MEDKNFDLNAWIDELMPSLEDAYCEFLADPSHPFTDGPLARVSFYTALLREMEANPIEDDEEGLQAALTARVQGMRDRYLLQIENVIKHLK